MKATLLFTCMASSLLVLNGCGDGSDEPTDTTSRMGGIWAGSLTKVADECGSTEPLTISFNDQVTQNQDAIRLIDAVGDEFLGNVVGDNGFSVDRVDAVTVGRLRCTDQSRIAYDEIETDSDNTASVDKSITRTCPGRPDCEIVYSGSAARTGR